MTPPPERDEVCSMLVDVLAGDSAPLHEGLLAGHTAGLEEFDGDED